MGRMLGDCKRTREAIQTYSWTGVMCVLLHLTGARPHVQHGKLWHSQVQWCCPCTCMQMAQYHMTAAVC